MENNIKDIIESANIQFPYVAIYSRYGHLTEQEFDSFEEATHFLSVLEESGEGSAVAITHFDTAYIPNNEMFGVELNALTEQTLSEIRKVGRDASKFGYFTLKI